jgi:hypothetical protein
MDILTGNAGWIEVICGPMFSGKSEELIRRLRRAMIARKRVAVFKPKIDDRYSAEEIVSHGDLRMESQVISDAGEMLERIDWRAEVVGVDEANFMGPSLVEVAGRLADSGKQVIIARAWIRTTWGGPLRRFRICWRRPNPSPRRWRCACAAATRPSTRSGCAAPTT